MSDYLTNLIRRSFGRMEVVHPRPIGLFETPSSTGKFVPKYYANPETMAEGEADSKVTSESPSAVSPLSKSRNASGTGAQGGSKSRQHQMGDVRKNSNRSPRQPTDQQLPLSGRVAFQSPEMRMKRLPSHPDSYPAKSKPSTHRLPPIKAISGQRPSQPATNSTVSEPSQIVIKKTVQESGNEQHLAPSMITRSMAHTMVLQSSSAQQGEAELEKAVSPDMSERSDHLKASPSPTIAFPEPRPMLSSTIKPDLTRMHVEAYTGLINKASIESVINVTIGSIEVRAIQSREPELPRSQGKPSGVMSLDQYLTMRSQRGS